ncbi:DNA-3-methyladenine glycosylase [Nocardioides sp.]|uniref:DNA-3-methyladenine glycosylase n=1 Tax=Nocardioides sp. TaxID=35761 RepID=UPI0039C91B75
MPDLASRLAGPVLDVAPTLLGSTLRCGDVAVRITEVEAYAGADDPGSHSFRGPTPRNAIMFGPPGHLYVYFTYGMHHCANVVCGSEGTSAAVLLRAGEVVEGTWTARDRRSRSTDRDLARGPARLCRALGIDLADNGNNLTDGRIRLSLGDAPVPGAVSRGPRVGLRGAADYPWRFWLTGERSVSTYRPATVRAPLKGL